MDKLGELLYQRYANLLQENITLKKRNAELEIEYVEKSLMEEDCDMALREWRHKFLKRFENDSIPVVMTGKTVGKLPKSEEELEQLVTLDAPVHSQLRRVMSVKELDTILTTNLHVAAPTAATEAEPTRYWTECHLLSLDETYTQCTVAATDGTAQFHCSPAELIPLPYPHRSLDLAVGSLVFAQQPIKDSNRQQWTARFVPAGVVTLVSDDEVMLLYTTLESVVRVPVARIIPVTVAQVSEAAEQRQEQLEQELEQIRSTAIRFEQDLLSPPKQPADSTAAPASASAQQSEKADDAEPMVWESSSAVPEQEQEQQKQEQEQEQQQQEQEQQQQQEQEQEQEQEHEPQPNEHQHQRQHRQLLGVPTSSVERVQSEPPPESPSEIVAGSHSAPAERFPSEPPPPVAPPSAASGPAIPDTSPTSVPRSQTPTGFLEPQRAHSVSGQQQQQQGGATTGSPLLAPERAHSEPPPPLPQSE